MAPVPRSLNAERVAALRALYSDIPFPYTGLVEESTGDASYAKRTLQADRTEDTSADLFDSILTPILKLVQRKLCKTLVEKGNLTKCEVPITELSDDDNNLPIKTLSLDFGSIKSFRSAAELHAEQSKHPGFVWPRRAAEQLERKELLVLDLKGVRVRAEFADGVEFKLPIPNAPVPLAVEVGSNLEAGEAGGRGAEKDGSVELLIGYLRLWWNRPKMELSIAFMEVPVFTPNLDVAVEVHGRDLGINIKRGGLIEYLVTSILSSYGPCSAKFQGANCVNRAWGSALKLVLRKALGGIDKNAHKEGQGTPLRIDLNPKPKPQLGSVEDVVGECGELKEMADAVLALDPSEIDCEPGRRDELVEAMADAELNLARLERLAMSRSERLRQAVEKCCLAPQK